MECIFCKENDIIKHGKQKGLQRYYCNDCKRTFNENARYRPNNASIKRDALHLMLEGYSSNEISEYLNLSYDTVNNWKNKYLRKVKELLTDKAESTLKEDIGDITISFKQTKKLSPNRKGKKLLS